MTLTTEITVDSVRNCKPSDARRAPMTFLKPISIARRVDRAVARFMKLIQAMTRIKIATTNRIRT